MISSQAIASREISNTSSTVIEPFLVGTARITLTTNGSVAALPDFVIDGTATLSIEASASVVATTRSVSGTAVLNTDLTFSSASPATFSGEVFIGLTSSSVVASPAPLAGSVSIPLLVSGSISSINGVSSTKSILDLTVSGSITSPVIIEATANIALDILGYLRNQLSFDINSVDTFVVNTSTGGHAVYTNQPFNSYFKVGNTYFGTSANGIFSIDSINTDQWAAKTALTNFGSNKQKLIADCYIEARTDSDISIELSNGESTVRSGYSIIPDGDVGVHRRRVKTHKGLKSNYWQLSLSGSDTVEITNASLAINETRRSI